MAYVKFTNPRGTFRPRATIRRGGTIGLNRAAVQRFNLYKYKNVILYYDANEKKIGIEFAGDVVLPEAIPFKIRSGNFGISASISARSFFDCFEIKYDERVTNDLVEEKLDERRLYAFSVIRKEKVGKKHDVK